MKKPVIVALCCLLALSTGTAAFAEEPTPTPAPELVELSPEDPAPQFYPDSISWQEAACRQAVQRTVWHSRCRLDRKRYAVGRFRLHLMGCYTVCGGRCDRRKRGHTGF